MTAFTGTATYYARYRPAYPEAFLADIRSIAGVGGSGLLLDLACGPGRVAIPMAAHFDRVLAIDVEPEMIAIGRAEADERGAANVEWRVGRAEDLQLTAGSVDLVTVGEAFHRLDQQRILQRALQWLRAGGSFVTLGGEPVWRGDEVWKRALVDVVNAWTHGALGTPNECRWGGPDDELRGIGLTVHEGELAIEHVWTCDSIVGFMFSTSIASRRMLGDDANRFESELRAALLALEPDDRFVSMQRFGFTLGTKHDDKR